MVLTKKANREFELSLLAGKKPRDRAYCATCNGKEEKSGQGFSNISGGEAKNVGKRIEPLGGSTCLGRI